jgi:uncharacterized protein (DUF1015 family)
MPRFEAFAGLRYDPARAETTSVIAPPYDVIAEAERAALEARSPYNSVRIDFPRGDYAGVAGLLAAWQREETLVGDEPSLYGYRMSFKGEDGAPRRTEGVIGALGIETPGEGDVLPHEHTTPKAKSDRLQLLRAARVNTSPIWGLSMAAGLSASLALDEPATAAAIDDDGVRHELWRIDDGRVAAIIGLVESAPIVIADGHHRYETAHNYREERRAAGDGPGAHDLVMALVVELSPEQLEVRAIHRLVSGLPEGFDVAAALEKSFDVTETDAEGAGLLTAMRTTRALGLVTPTGRWLLHPLPPTLAAAEHDLDSSRLDVALASLPQHELRFQHGVDEVTAAVAQGEADAAVLLRPATVDQITETGRTRRRMPPKTTFFWPKPRTGLVFRSV